MNKAAREHYYANIQRIMKEVKKEHNGLLPKSDVHAKLSADFSTDQNKKYDKLLRVALQHIGSKKVKEQLYKQYKDLTTSNL